MNGVGASATVTATVTAGSVSLSSSTVTVVAGQQALVTASQGGNTGNAYSAASSITNATVATNTSSSNNVVITGAAPTASGTPAIVTVTGLNGSTATVSVTVLPAAVVATGTFSVTAGSTGTFSVSQVGNSGSYTVASSNTGIATATVQSQNASGATIAVTGVSAGSNVNITVTGQGGTPAVVAFTIAPGAISISPNISTLSLAVGATSAPITVVEPGNSSFTATVPAGTTAVSTTVSGSTVVIKGVSATSGVNVSINGATGATPKVITVSVNAPAPNSDAQIVSALQAAGATSVWPMNDAVSGATTLANGVSGGASIAFSSGSSSTATQAYPIVANSSHSAFFNPLVGTASTGQMLSASAPWTVGITILPSSIAGTKPYEVWSAGEPFSGHTGVALYLVQATGQVKLGYGVSVSGGTTTYNTVSASTSNDVTASSGPATAFAQGHYVSASWSGTQFSLTVDNAAPVVVTPTNTFVSSTTPLSVGNSTNTSAALAYLGYAQYLFYSATALSSPNNTAAYDAVTGQGSSTPSMAPSMNPSSPPTTAAITITPVGGGSPTMGANFTTGGAQQQFSLAQGSTTTGFSIIAPTPAPSCAAVALGTGSNANILSITPGSIACSASVNIQGTAGASLHARFKTAGSGVRK